MKTKSLARSVICLPAGLLLLMLFSVASSAMGDDSAPTWEKMSVDQKLETLKTSALELGDEGEVSNGNLYGETNTLWTCLAAFLVFFMQAGFAMVETGFTRAKNACNIIMKNLMDFSIGSVTFWLVGFGLMFGVSAGGLIGTKRFPLRCRR